MDSQISEIKKMGVYGPAIVGLNLVVLLASIILIYFANVLISFYLLPTLGTDIFVYRLSQFLKK